MARFAARVCVIIGIALCSAGAFCQTADDILAHTQMRVRQIDSLNLTISGSFVQHVQAIYSLGDQSGTAEKTYTITFTNGIQDSRTPVPATDTAAMPIRNAPRSTTVLALRDVILPYKASLEDATGDHAIHSSLEQDSSIDGIPCYTIFFDYYSAMDSSRVHGGGRIWIAKTDYTPVLSSYDFDGSSFSRGKFATNVTAKILRVNQTAVIGENTTHISFNDGEHDLGGETTKVRNLNFAIKK